MNEPGILTGGSTFSAIPILHPDASLPTFSYRQPLPHPPPSSVHPISNFSILLLKKIRGSQPCNVDHAGKVHELNRTMEATSLRTGSTAVSFDCFPEMNFHSSGKPYKCNWTTVSIYIKRPKARGQGPMGPSLPVHLHRPYIH